MGLVNEINSINSNLSKQDRQRQERQEKKVFFEKIYYFCDEMLFDLILEKITDTNDLNIIYNSIERDKIIEKVFFNITLRYNLQNSSQEKINIYIGKNYLKIANKVVNIYKKIEKQKEIKDTPKQITDTTQKKERKSDELFLKCAMLLELLITSFLFLFPVIFILKILIELFSL